MKTIYIKLEDVIHFFEEAGTLQRGVRHRIAPIKPKHIWMPNKGYGPCFICQACGRSYSDCVCSHNKTIDWIEHLEKIDGDI